MPFNPRPADARWCDDEINPTAAALGAGEPAGQIGHREIGAALLGLLAGIEVDAAQADGAPDAQQEMRHGHAAEASPDPIRPHDHRDRFPAVGERAAAPRSGGKVRTAPSGADDRQVPTQHINELRQAVDAGPAKKRTDSSDGRVSPEPVGALQGMAFGAEAKQLKFMALGPPLFPLREHRARAVQLDGKRYDDYQRQGKSDQHDSD